MEKKTFNMLGFGLLAMTIATTAGQVLFSIICATVFPAFTYTPAFTFLSVTMFYLFGMPALWVFVRRLPVCAPEPEQPVTVKSTALGFGLSLGTTYIFNFLGMLLIVLISLLRGAEVPNAVGELLGQGEILWNIIIVGICSPIVEEIVFRKILLDRLKPFGDLVAILYSSVAFGLFHMNLYQFFYATALGMLFAYITLRMGSIKQTIILHMLVNLFGSVVSVLIQQYNSVIGIMALGLVVIASILFAVIWYATHFRQLRLTGPRFSFSQRITGPLVCANAGTILYVLFCLVFIVIATFFT